MSDGNPLPSVVWVVEHMPGDDRQWNVCAVFSTSVRASEWLVDTVKAWTPDDEDPKNWYDGQSYYFVSCVRVNPEATQEVVAG